MGRQIRILTKLELCNLYNFNVLRHMKDPAQKKKSTVFIGIIVFLLLGLLSYIVALCVGLGVLGAAEIIPAYLIALSSFFILFFDVFKIGGVIFCQKGYDITTSLPLSDGAVVTSRFLRMYVESLIVSGFIFLPGMLVYSVFEKPTIASFPVAIFTLLMLPLFPLAVAVLLGSVITGIASRMKRKALAEAGFSLVVVIGVLALGTQMGGMEEEFTPQMLTKLIQTATQALQRTYPPAIYLGNAIGNGSFGMCLLFGAVSVLLVAALMWIVTLNYHTICRNLYEVRSKHNYRIGQLKTTSVKKAVLVRESKRYFASGPYVSNTIIGPALGALMSVALLFADVESVVSKMMVQAQMPVSLNVTPVIPIVVAAVMAMMNPVCISVSMEGKEWWISKTLPLDTKTILDGKLLFCLLLIAPFFVVSQICLMIALELKPLVGICVMILSMLWIVFSCVFGLWINLLFPKFDWENETVAVKQSAASLIGGMGGTLIAMLGAFFILLVPERFEMILYLLEIVIVFCVTRRLYLKNIKMDLSKIH